MGFLFLLVCVLPISLRLLLRARFVCRILGEMSWIINIKEAKADYCLHGVDVGAYGLEFIGLGYQQRLLWAVFD